MSRSDIEKEFATKMAREHLPVKQFEAWQNSGYTLRLQCAVDDVLVVWQYTGAEMYSENFWCLDVEDIWVSEKVCVRLCEQVLSHTPAPLVGCPIFAHVPFMPDLCYLPERPGSDDFRLQCSMVFKTKSHPDRPVVGDWYISTVSDFKQRFPEFKNTTF